MKCVSLLAAIGTLFVAVGSVRAEVSLAPVFGDHMVLQRDASVPVWGTCKPNAAVAVSFADQVKHTTADQRGRWQVQLDPMPARARPSDLIARSGGAARTIKEVLVGEVWLAAGQSNMEWPLTRDKRSREELPRANRPRLRLLNLGYVGQGFFARPFGRTEIERLTPERYYEGRWAVCTPESARAFSAVAYYFGSDLLDQLEVPVGVLHLAVGGSPTEAWIARQSLADDAELRSLVKGPWLKNEKLDPWCLKRASENLDRALKEGIKVPGDDLGPHHGFEPGFLWAAGPARLAPFAARGVLWYQGESNAESAWRVRQHGRLFPLLVESWRKAWGKDLPFLYVQLPGLNRPHWPAFRDQQRRLLARVPNTGMAMTIDLGHPTDVHPTDKKPVGARLARLALATVYGKKIEATGPLFRAAQRRDRCLVVTFEGGAGLHTRDGKSPRGFEIAGADGRFVTAAAKIRNNAVLVTAAEVSAPRHVRYAWQPFPRPPLNLVNGADLPASPFTSQPED